MEEKLGLPIETSTPLLRGAQSQIRRWYLYIPPFL